MRRLRRNLETAWFHENVGDSALGTISVAGWGSGWISIASGILTGRMLYLYYLCLHPQVFYSSVILWRHRQLHGDQYFFLEDVDADVEVDQSFPPN